MIFRRKSQASRPRPADDHSDSSNIINNDDNNNDNSNNFTINGSSCSSGNIVEIRQQYERAGQGHVFAFYDELSTAEQCALIDQLTEIDSPVKINELAAKALADVGAAAGASADAYNHSEPEKRSHHPPHIDVIVPEQCESMFTTGPGIRKIWRDRGLDLIATNKVAVVLMAGGQGTRLGSSDPKGCYNIGLPSGKSLFQLQAERIIRLKTLAATSRPGLNPSEVVIAWYVMTSKPTREPTVKFFQQHNYFGLNEEDVIVFEQGLLPCISDQGKILMESRSQVVTAPNGNGGVYEGLLRSGSIADMHHRGIEHIHMHAVDNCLVRVADPVFIGFCADKKVDVGTKVVRKRSAHEPVGLVVQTNGHPAVIEYTELPKHLAHLKDESDPELFKFRAANIVNHYFSIAFFDSIPAWTNKLSYHIARKKIGHHSIETDTFVKPDKPNGIKLEQFVFDSFPLVNLDKFAVLEVRREDEFSPLKNASGTGEDDPETSRTHIMAQGARWLLDAGVCILPGDGEPDDAIGQENANAHKGNRSFMVEVSPLVSYSGENLGNKFNTSCANSTSPTVTASITTPSTISSSQFNSRDGIVGDSGRAGGDAAFVRSGDYIC